MASEVVQKIVGPLMEAAAGGIQSSGLVRAQRSSSPRGSIHVGASRASRRVNSCAVPRAQQFAMCCSSAAAPCSIRESWSGSSHCVNPFAGGLLRQAAQPAAPADSPVAASRRQVCC